MFEFRVHCCANAVDTYANDIVTAHKAALYIAVERRRQQTLELTLKNELKFNLKIIQKHNEFHRLPEISRR